MSLADTDLIVEIDGPDVAPSTVDARVLLDLASAYFDLLTRVAAGRGTPIELRGLQIVDKCVAVLTSTPHEPTARSAVAEARDLLTGRDDPTGYLQAIERVHIARRRLPEGHSAKVALGELETVIELPAPVVDLGPPESTISVRAIPIRTGGVTPRVRFRSDAEEDEFTLSVTADQAREMGPQLYREVDISATVVRDSDDRIRTGRLDEFYVLDDGAPREAWKAWFAANAPQWGSVDDIERTLREEDE